MHRGYIPLWRKIFDHPFWTEKRSFSKMEAWLDILANTQFEREPKTRIIKGQKIIQNYGEAILSTRYCGQRWGWPKSTVFRFFILLRDCEMIVTKPGQKINRLIIVNFDTYDIRNAEGWDSNGTVTGQSRDSNGTVTGQTKELKNDKSVKSVNTNPPTP